MRPARPIAAEPEQRYWRRRANLRVRKARMAKSAARWAIVIGVNVLIAGVLLYAGFSAVRGLGRSDEFALRVVTIDGARRASAERIRAMLEPYHGRSIFELDLAEVKAIATRDPWVAGASIKRVLPDRLRVELTERVPVTRALIDGIPHLVDGDGHVIGRTGPEMADDLPVLTGLSSERDALVADLRRGAILIQRLRRSAPAFADAISELELGRPDRVIVRTTHPGPRLLLDPTRVERNVHHYLEFGGGLEQQAGPLEYVDLRWQDRISVMPATRMEAER